MVVIFEGHERAGKTHIAEKLSEILGIEVYIPPNRGCQLAETDTSNEYDEATALLENLYDNEEDVIFDRFHGSEWVYSRIFNRKTDEAGFYRMERMLKNKFKTRIIICHKDDNMVSADGNITRDTNIMIKNEFTKFYLKTECPVLLLNTSDSDLKTQIETIIKFLKEGK